MIELKHVSAGYGKNAVLEDISLKFPEGKITVLLGPNGCGKTTIMKTALGLIPPIGGSILYDGVDIKELSSADVARKAAYMAQNRAVPNITAKRLVLHGRFAWLSFPRHYRKEDKEEVAKALEKADAAELSDEYLPKLSGGQRQKVYLAMALAQGTPAVFMDEPTSFLDIRHQLEVMETAKTLAAQGKAVVVVSHDIGLALKNADVAAVFHDGKMLKVGIPDEIYESGALNDAFGVTISRIQAENDVFYYAH